MSFAGCVALVTGATSGIGLAIAEQLALAGARVLVNSEDREACERVAAELPGAVAIGADLADVSEVELLAERVLELGGIDHLFLNAGITGRLQSGEDGYEAEVTRVFAVNVHHPRILCDRLLPAIAERGGGTAVLTASLAALRGNRSLGVYPLTKAALAQLARDMAVKWGPGGVRVNALAPGLIATGWERAILANPRQAERRLQMTPLRRIGQPAEVAAAAIFLASASASFITGQLLAVDGGTSITDGN